VLHHIGATAVVCSKIAKASCNKIVHC